MKNSALDTANIDNTTSVEYLIEQINKLRKENLKLHQELAQLKRYLYGKRSEKNKPSASVTTEPTLFDGSPGTLDDVSKENSQPASNKDEGKTKKNKTAQNKKNKNSTPRRPLPDFLPREEIVIQPEDYDPETMTLIGQDENETLAFSPARLYVIKTIRPKYIVKNDADKGVCQARQRPRIIPNGRIDESLLADIIIKKIVYHQPIHRYHQQLKQLGIHILSTSALHQNIHSIAQQLAPLYELIGHQMRQTNYLQADETYIKVIKNNKKNASHRGYIWVLHNPANKACYYQYDPSRSTLAGSALIQDFQGTIQSDGYEVYETLAKKKSLQLIYCMAHARRKFFNAQDSDTTGAAEHFLKKVAQLYTIEAHCRDHQFSPEDRYAYRQEHALPILKELGQWLKEQYCKGNHLPQSPLAKAINYALKRWKGLSEYAHKGHYEIDNNWIENSIRPWAIGRKNYLFANNHDTAQNLAILYTILATAKQYQLDLQRYFTWLLRKVANNKITPEAINWLPQNFTPQQLRDFAIPET